MFCFALFQLNVDVAVSVIVHVFEASQCNLNVQITFHDAAGMLAYNVLTCQILRQYRSANCILVSIPC